MGKIQEIDFIRPDKVIGSRRAAVSPNPHVRLGRSPHRLIGFDAEGFVEFRDIGQGPEHAPFGGGVHVAEQAAPRFGAVSLPV